MHITRIAAILSTSPGLISETLRLPLLIVFVVLVLSTVFDRRQPNTLTFQGVLIWAFIILLIFALGSLSIS